MSDSSLRAVAVSSSEITWICLRIGVSISEGDFLRGYKAQHIFGCSLHRPLLLTQVPINCFWRHPYRHTAAIPNHKMLTADIGDDST